MNTLNQTDKQDFFIYLSNGDDNKIQEMIGNNILYKKDVFFLNELPRSFFDAINNISVNILNSKQKASFWKDYQENSHNYLDREEDIYLNSIPTINLQTVLLLLNKTKLIEDLYNQKEDVIKNQTIAEEYKYWNEIFTTTMAEESMSICAAMDYLNNSFSSQWLEMFKDEFIRDINSYALSYLAYSKKKTFEENQAKTFLNFLVLTKITEIGEESYAFYEKNIPSNSLKNVIELFLNKNETDFLIDLFKNRDPEKNFYIMKKLVYEATKDNNVNFFFKINQWWSCVVKNSSNQQYPLEYILYKKSIKPQGNEFLSSVLNNKISFENLRNFIIKSSINPHVNTNQFGFLYDMNANIDVEGMREEYLSVGKTGNTKKLKKTLEMLKFVFEKDEDIFQQINKNNEIIDVFANNSAVSKKDQSFLQYIIINNDIKKNDLGKNKKMVL